MFGLVGCAAGAPPKRAAATRPSGGEIKLGEAQPLDDLLTDDWQINLTDKLSKPLVGQTIYFGELDAFDSDDEKTATSAIPVIAVRVGDGWKALPLSGPGLVDAGWKYVGAGPGKNEVWGVLDTAAGDTRSRFVVTHSVDGGQSFSLTVFKKPCKLATVFDFAMSRAGQGRVTLSLDTDFEKLKAGLYHYETSDDGKTWSATPRFEADAMIRADTVGEDEQPDQATPPERTIWHGRGRPGK